MSNNVQYHSKFLKCEIKKQFFINETGHFKYFKNNTILINFIDKVKLCMDDYSLKMFLKNNLQKSFCIIYLPDNSQHEICLSEKNEINSFFGKYVSFLEQWLTWLLETETIKKETNEKSSNFSSQMNEQLGDSLDFKSLQTHLSHLKLFNFSIDQDLNKSEREKDSLSSKETVISVSSLLKENGQFLKNISK